MDAQVDERHRHKHAFQAAESHHVRRNVAKEKRKSVATVEARATARMLRVSPQKLNLVAALIRGKSAVSALSDLQFARKRVAVDVKKCLQSAIANAENNHDLDVDRLVVSEAHVGQGLKMKRSAVHGRGRSGRVDKPFSQLTVVVRESEPVAKKRPREVSRVSIEPSQKSKTSVLEAIRGLQACLQSRPDYDRTRMELARLSDLASRPTKDGNSNRFALAAARAAVPVLIAGPDQERRASFMLLSIALKEFAPTQTIADFLQSERVPCVTEIATDHHELSTIGQRKPLRIVAALNRAIRVVDSKLERPTVLDTLKPWPTALTFSIRVGAPRARIEPPTENVVEFAAGKEQTAASFVIIPSEAGALPVTIDFLLMGSRFARRTLQFVAK
ncbi:ribosomal protein L22 [Bradyrhizobium sp. USDA 4472]